MNIGIKIIGALLLFALTYSGCFSANETPAKNPGEIRGGQAKNKGDNYPGNIGAGNSREGSIANQSNKRPIPQAVKGFFMLLPEKYFVVESCEEAKDKDCTQAKKQYLKDYLTVEDIRSGYLAAGGDGAQTSFKMAIFNRGNNSYLIGLNVFSENDNTFRFLDFADGKWEDVSIEVVPEYSTTNIYELPRQGTTVPVFAKKIIAQGEGFEASEKGEKLYDLHWENGAFSIAR